MNYGQCKLRKSFCGHAGSFAGLVFLSWYLSGKVRVFDRRGHVAKLCLVLLPVLTAAMIGVSRVDDYWHHWQDVFAGGLIGLFIEARLIKYFTKALCKVSYKNFILAGTVISSFCYLQFFPPPYDIDGMSMNRFFHIIIPL